MFSALRSLFKGSRTKSSKTKISQNRIASLQTSRAKQDPDPDPVEIDALIARLHEEVTKRGKQDPDPELVEIDALIARLHEEVTKRVNKEERERHWWGNDKPDPTSIKLRNRVIIAEKALSKVLEDRDEILKHRKTRAHGGRRRYTRKRKGIRR